MDSNITFLSAFLISIFFLISILAIESSLHMTTINYNSLNTELIKFFNLVENNKYSNMFICDYNINIFYVNKKIKEYYNFQEELTKFKNDLINNKYFYSKLKEIFDDLNNKVYWHGIIKNSIKNELLDCYIQKLNINNKDEFLVSYIVVNNNK
ncbi:MAG: sensor histidine kinase, partial [Clostridium sp.]|nr:sensor histidine kinase [Clostridium sp.]